MIAFITALIRKLLAVCGLRRPAVEEPMAVHFLYFAYGSNMLTERLTARTPSAEPQGTGVLAGYRLTFEKPSVGRSGTSGKGHIVETHQPADRVLGVVFKILKADEETLDEAEGDGYAKQNLDVETNGGVRRALVYVAKEKDATVRPYHWYKALVIAGAIQHGLPASYVDLIWAVESIADPLPRRTKKLEAEALLKKVGGPAWDWYETLRAPRTT